MSSPRVLRAFSFEKGHLKDKGNGWRLNSAWFRSKRPLSVYLESVTKLSDVVAKHPGWGIAAIPLDLLQTLGLTPSEDPEGHPDDLPGHRVVSNYDSEVSTKVAAAAEIVVRQDGYQVVGTDGSVGVAASSLADF